MQSQRACSARLRNFKYASPFLFDHVYYPQSLFHLLALTRTGFSIDKIIRKANTKFCPILLQIQSPLSQSYLMSSESTIYYFDIEFHKYNNNKKERREGGNKWLEDEEGNPKKWQKWGWEKKEKTEGETECFLVSSGGLAFVWNENSECLRDYSGLAGPWEPSSYLYTSNMEYGNHRSVCVHAEKCMCLLLWADEWQFKQTHNVVNQKIKKTNQKQKSLFCLTTSSSSPLCQHAVMKFHRALFLFYSVLSLGHRLCFSSTFIHTFTASLLHPCRWGRKIAAMLHWFWEAVILGLCPTSD